MRAYRLSTIFFAVALAAVGCDNDPRPMTDAGTPRPDSGGGGVDSGPRPDTGTPPTGDGNDSFATATPIGAEAAMGRIDPAGDLDYYSFTGTAGQWVIIATEANAEDDPDMVDTVVTLYDASMNQIAENDDGVPRVNTDSELITRLPADGTYYVLVQEWSTWAGETAEADPTFTYALTVASLNASAEAVTVDSEPGNLAEDAQTLGFNVGTNVDFALVAGLLDGETDGVDVFAASASTTRRLLQAQLMPVGTDGNGSTLTPTSITVTNADGTVTIAEVDPGALQSADRDMEIGPNLPDGEYRIWIEREGGAGANDFYVFKVTRFEDNPAEAAEATNGVFATPEALTQMDDMGVSRAFVLATLGDGDTDHFSVNVTDASHVVTVVCSSRSSGSGVVDLNVALLDPSGSELAAVTEAAATPALIEAQAVTATGAHVIRLTKASQSADVTGNWVRCGVAIGPPATGGA